MNLILNTGTQRAAKTSRVQVGSQNLAYASWEANLSAADLPTVNFESYNSQDNETYDEGLHGVLKCGLRFGGAWDANTNPFASPPGLYVRDDLGYQTGGVTFITSRLDANLNWAFPIVRVRGATNSGTVDGLVLFNVSEAMNQGRFTVPGGGIG